VWRERSFAFRPELPHFVDCVQQDLPPLETGEDGRAVPEIIFAAYDSAGTGHEVALPFAPPEGLKPVEWWRR
jgi:predicted dehydrogenase